MVDLAVRESAEVVRRMKKLLKDTELLWPMLILLAPGIKGWRKCSGVNKKCFKGCPPQDLSQPRRGGSSEKPS